MIDVARKSPDRPAGSFALATVRPDLFLSLIIVEGPFHGLRRPTQAPTAVATATLVQLRDRLDEGDCHHVSLADWRA